MLDNVTNSTVCPDKSMVLSCSLFGPGQEALVEAIQNIRLVMSSLSFIGSVIVISIILLLKKYRVLPSRLVLYLSITSLIFSIIYMLGRFTPTFSDLNSSDEAFCSALGFFVLVIDWALVLWFTIITVNLIINTMLLKRTDKLEIVYILVATLVPPVISCFGFISNEYGVAFGIAGAWCWIRDINVIDRETQNFYCCHYSGGDIFRFVLWYVPQILLLLFLLLANAVIVIKYWRKSQSWQGTYNPEVEHQKKMMKDDVKPLLLYPTIYLITQFFPLINRINSWANPLHPQPVLWVLHVLTVPLGGVLVALCYVLVDKDTRARLTWANCKASLKSCRWGDDKEVSEYVVQQKNYQPLPEENIPRADSKDPILPQPRK